MSKDTTTHKTKKTELIIIAKDDYPLELFRGKPVTNFFRKMFLSSHLECKTCYEKRKNIKVNTK